ncbi:MAG: hemerythrin domain-containing protein [Acidimicrobiia bacterium]
MDIFEALRSDHERQRDLVDRLLQTEGASDERQDLFERLTVELEAHAGAEERFFYVPLMEHDLTQEKARHSVAEHHELDELVEQLQEYDMSGSQWIQTARDLAHRLTHHLDEEEHEVFQMAGKALTEQQKSDLAAEYTDDMDRRRASA